MPRYKYHIIYKTTNQINDMFYIGVHSTNDLGDDYLGSGSALLKAVKEYGAENFKRETIEMLPNRKAAYDREKEIVDIDMMKNKQSYNIARGGKGAPVLQHTEETKRKMSLTRKGRPLGPASEEHRRKNSEAQKRIGGRPHSNETKRKISESNKGRHHWTPEQRQAMSDKKKGTKHSAETKRKIGEASKGRVFSEEHKRKISEARKRWWAKQTTS